MLSPGEFSGVYRVEPDLQQFGAVIADGLFLLDYISNVENPLIIEVSGFRRVQGNDGLKPGVNIGGVLNPVIIEVVVIRSGQVSVIVRQRDVVNVDNAVCVTIQRKVIYNPAGPQEQSRNIDRSGFSLTLNGIGIK